MPRPALPPEQRRTRRFQLLMTEREFEVARLLAERLGCSIGEALRRSMAAMDEATP